MRGLNRGALDLREPPQRSRKVSWKRCPSARRASKLSRLRLVQGAAAIRYAWGILMGQNSVPRSGRLVVLPAQRPIRAVQHSTNPCMIGADVKSFCLSLQRAPIALHGCAALVVEPSQIVIVLSRTPDRQCRALSTIHMLRCAYGKVAPPASHYGTLELLLCNSIFNLAHCSDRLNASCTTGSSSNSASSAWHR